MSTRIAAPARKVQAPIELPLIVPADAPDDGDSVTVDAMTDETGHGWIRLEITTEDGEATFFDLKPTEARMIGGALRTAASRAARHNRDKDK